MAATITLTEDDTTRSRLITDNEVVGHFAMWAVRQHPYRRPDGLFDLCDLIMEKAKAWTDGVPTLRMWRVGGWPEIERWLKASLEGNPILVAWNTPRSGHTQQIVASSRYWGPKPEDDFIDIDALLRNVALGVWRAATEDE